MVGSSIPSAVSANIFQAFTPLQPGLSLNLVLLCALFAAVSIAFLRCSRIRRRLEKEHAAKIDLMRRELRKSVLRYKNLLDDAGDAIFVIDPSSGRLEEMNRRGIELLGYARDELGALDGSKFIALQDRRKFAALVTRINERGKATFGKITFRRSDGTTFLGEINARLIELDDGQVVHAIIRDITEKNRFEREIRQRNRELVILNDLIVRANQNLQLQNVLEVTLAETLDVLGVEGGGIYLQENIGNALRFASKGLSPELSRILEEGDLASGIYGGVGGEADQTLHDLSRSRHPAANTAAAEGWNFFAGVPLYAKGQPVGVIYMLTRKARCFTDDEVKLLTAIGHQVGTIIQHSRLFEELTWKTDELLRSHRLLEKSSHRLAVSQERLRQNLDLVEKANMELEHLDRMKTHFLGMISHEFKTPLTTIIGGSEFLICSGGPRNHEEAKILEIIRKGGERLNEIVNDLLKLARLESQTPTLAKIPLSLVDIFDLIVINLQPLLAERNLAINVTGLNEIPFCSGNRDYLEEIFTELLQNAIKFTPDGGGINVVASIAAAEELAGKQELLARFNPSFMNQNHSGRYLQVQIKDSGIGINSQDHTKVFDKFYEVGDICNHSTGKYKFQGKGTGLGLAIVKGMVEAHGGMVWVESSGMDTLRNPGSSFFILLPLEEGARQPVFAFMEKETPYLSNKPYHVVK